VVQKSVEYGCGDGLVAEDVAPIRDLLIRGEQDAAALVALCDELKNRCAVARSSGKYPSSSMTRSLGLAKKPSWSPKCPSACACFVHRSLQGGEGSELVARGGQFTWRLTGRNTAFRANRTGDSHHASRPRSRSSDRIDNPDLCAESAFGIKENHPNARAQLRWYGLARCHTPRTALSVATAGDRATLRSVTWATRRARTRQLAASSSSSRCLNQCCRLALELGFVQRSERPSERCTLIRGPMCSAAVWCLRAQYGLQTPGEPRLPGANEIWNSRSPV
jgi:hypothetical protein